MAFGCSSDSDGNPVEQTYIETEEDLIGTWALIKITEGEFTEDVSDGCNTDKGRLVFAEAITEIKGTQVGQNCVESQTHYDSYSVGELGQVTLIKGDVKYFYRTYVDGQVLKITRYSYQIGNEEPEVTDAFNLVYFYYVKLD